MLCYYDRFKQFWHVRISEFNSLQYNYLGTLNHHEQFDNNDNAWGLTQLSILDLLVVPHLNYTRAHLIKFIVLCHINC